MTALKRTLTRKHGHIQKASPPRSHIYIYISIYLSGKNVIISDGAGYYPDLWIGWHIFISSDSLKKYKVLDMFEEKASLLKFNYSILETGKKKTMIVLYT